MAKLLNAYRADPSLRNACKIRAYDKSHPMAACLLSAVDAETLFLAVAFADSKFNRVSV